MGGWPILQWAKARRSRATRTKGGGYDFLRSVPPTYHGVSAVEPRLKAWGGARQALAYNTTTPSPHCASRAPWAVGQYSKGRTARGPRATGFKRQLLPSKPTPLRSVSVWCGRASAYGVGRSAHDSRGHGSCATTPKTRDATHRHKRVRAFTPIRVAGSAFIATE